MEEYKGNKLTIYDIAQELNLSIATVSRALNGKEDINERTRDRILETAKRMGYKASRTAASLSRKEKRFAALFPDLFYDYSNEVKRGIQQAVEDLRDYHISVEIESLPVDAEIYAGRLQELAYQGYDGVILMPPEGEAKLSNLMEKLRLGRMPVAVVTTELGRNSRIFLVQVNGRVAGRMAGELLGTVLGKGKKVALVTGQMTTQIHQRTAEGFLAETRAQELDFAGIFEHHDDPSMAYDLAGKLMEKHPDLDGIYLATANSITFCNRLKEMGYEGKLKIVASDIFPKMCEFLQSGMVMATIFQNPFQQGRLAVRYLYEYLIEQRVFEEDCILLEPQIVMNSNLELYEEKLQAMSEDILF